VQRVRDWRDLLCDSLAKLSYLEHRTRLGCVWDLYADSKPNASELLIAQVGVLVMCATYRSALYIHNVHVLSTVFGLYTAEVTRYQADGCFTIRSHTSVNSSWKVIVAIRSLWLLEHECDNSRNSRIGCCNENFAGFFKKLQQATSSDP